MQDKKKIPVALWPFVYVVLWVISPQFYVMAWRSYAVAVVTPLLLGLLARTLYIERQNTKAHMRTVGVLSVVGIVIASFVAFIGGFTAILLPLIIGIVIVIFGLDLARTAVRVFFEDFVELLEWLIEAIWAILKIISSPIARFFDLPVFRRVNRALKRMNIPLNVKPVAAIILLVFAVIGIKDYINSPPRAENAEDRCANIEGTWSGWLEEDLDINAPKSCIVHLAFASPELASFGRTEFQIATKKAVEPCIEEGLITNFAGATVKTGSIVSIEVWLDVNLWEDWGTALKRIQALKQPTEALQQWSDNPGCT